MSSPIHPVKFSLDDSFQFRCHKEIACFNKCCHYIDIQLTPYDILRLKQCLGLTSKEFLAQYTLPFEMDAEGMPGVKLKPLPNSNVCPFVTPAGCSVYPDRPTVCRYYALGLLSLHHQGTATDENAYVLIQEDHCLGHQEPRALTIREYRQEQGVEEYDEMNREWQRVILKKRSGGPALGKPSVRSYQFFFLGSYNLDELRNFVTSQGFLEIYELPGEEFEQLKTDEVALMIFGFRLLKQVLFGEMTIPMKEDAVVKRSQQRLDSSNQEEYQGPIIL